MRRFSTRQSLRVALGLGLALATTGCFLVQLLVVDAPWPHWYPAASKVWKPFESPDLPLRFEAPKNIGWYSGDAAGLRGQKWAMRGRQYGVHVIYAQYGERFYSIEFSFHLFPGRYPLVDPERVREVCAGIGDIEVVRKFLQEVLYRGTVRVRGENRVVIPGQSQILVPKGETRIIRRPIQVHDYGLERIGPYHARRVVAEAVKVEWGFHGGEKAGWTIPLWRSGVFLIVLDPSHLLVVEGRFDPEASEEEREEIFPRIARSVRWGREQGSRIGPDSSKSLRAASP